MFFSFGDALRKDLLYERSRTLELALTENSCGGVIFQRSYKGNIGQLELL